MYLSNCELPFRPDEEARFLQTSLANSQGVMEAGLRDAPVGEPVDSTAPSSEADTAPPVRHTSVMTLERIIANLRGCDLQTFEALRLLKAAAASPPLGDAAPHAQSFAVPIKETFPGLVNAEEACLARYQFAQPAPLDDGLSEEAVLVLSVYQADKPGTRLLVAKVLGSTLLTDFRDRIHCYSDTIYRMAVETGQSPLPNSSFLFIHDTFFNDLRAPEAKDCSQHFIEWAQKRRGVKGSRFSGSPARSPPAPMAMPASAKGPDPSSHRGRAPDFSGTDFQGRPMEGVRFSDIHMQLLTPYLFLHFGDCEHVVLLAELRSFHRDLDPPLYSMFPQVLYQAKSKKRKCRICETYHAVWVTVDDPLAPENPCLFCRDCYRMLHTDHLGRMIAPEHRVYPYLND